MRRANDLHSRLAALSASLTAPSEYEKRALVQLEELLVQARISEAASEFLPRELSVERASWYAPENLAPERRQRLEQLVTRVERLRAQAEIRLGRRRPTDQTHHPARDT